MHIIWRDVCKYGYGRVLFIINRLISNCCNSLIMRHTRGIYVYYQVYIYCEEKNGLSSITRDCNNPHLHNVLFFFHIQLWFPASHRDSRRFGSDFRWFILSCHIIVEEIKSIMGARAERSSPSWVYIPQKLLAITRDFWNANPFGWTPFHTGARDGFSISIRIYMCISYVKTCVKTGMEAFNPSRTASRKRNICI